MDSVVGLVAGRSSPGGGEESRIGRVKFSVLQLKTLLLLLVVVIVVVHVCVCV